MQEAVESPRRWDPIVKLTHWGIVAAVIVNALVAEEGSGWHIWVGYGLLALLALRLLWGVIGSPEARFGAFPPSPGRTVQHLREIARGEVTRHRSHNPLGALMSYAIWATLLVITVSGVAMSGPPPADPSAPRESAREAGSERDGVDDEADGHEARRGSGVSSGLAALLVPPARADDGEGGEQGEGDELFEEMHEVAVNLLYVLVALHLAGVVFESRRSGREIVGAMLPGGNRRA